jgi:hypothetical protein
VTKLAAGDSQRIHKSLQSSRGPVVALASIDLFNLDDTAFAPAHSIDGM